MGDLIDRDAAIDGKISTQRADGVELYSDEVVPVEYLRDLPSAQPEESLKSCKNCIHLGQAYMMPCKNCRRNQMMPDWYEVSDNG